ncbi:MAG: hypothetical protein KDI38_09375 [Calditrichaeota bacterium]|nr:hypothetical protein [Calditrichota bacterium]
MSPQLKTIIDEARGLSPLEQIELISAISQWLGEHYPGLSIHSDFWHPKTLEALLENHPAQPFEGIDDQAVDFWPEDESADEFNAFIEQQRHEDLLSGK